MKGQGKRIGTEWTKKEKKNRFKHSHTQFWKLQRNRVFKSQNLLSSLSLLKIFSSSFLNPYISISTTPTTIPHNIFMDSIWGSIFLRSRSHFSSSLSVQVKHFLREVHSFQFRSEFNSILPLFWSYQESNQSFPIFLDIGSPLHQVKGCCVSWNKFVY